MKVTISFIAYLSILSLFYHIRGITFLIAFQSQTLFSFKFEKHELVEEMKEKYFVVKRTCLHNKIDALITNGTAKWCVHCLKSKYFWPIVKTILSILNSMLPLTFLQIGRKLCKLFTKFNRNVLPVYLFITRFCGILTNQEYCIESLNESFSIKWFQLQIFSESTTHKWYIGIYRYLAWNSLTFTWYVMFTHAIITPTMLPNWKSFAKVNKHLIKNVLFKIWIVSWSETFNHKVSNKTHERW